MMDPMTGGPTAPPTIDPSSDPPYAPALDVALPTLVGRFSKQIKT